MVFRKITMSKNGNNITTYIGRHYPKTYAVFCVLLGVLIPFITLNIGICEFDEFYQIICSQYYSEQPLASLSFYLSNLWIRLFGDTAMSYRYFAYVINTILIAVPVLFYYKSTLKLLQSAIMFLILQLSYNIFTFSFFNWDVPSNLFIVCSICTILSYYNTKEIKYLIILAIFTSCATLCRIPNISLFVCSILFIIVTAKEFRYKFCHTGIYTIIYICTSLLMIHLIFGGIAQYVSAWNDNNIINGHSSIIRIFGWINGAPQRELPMIFGAVTLFVMIYLLHKLHQLNNRFYLFLIIVFWWGYLSLIAFTQSLIAISSYQVGFFYLIIGLYFVDRLYYQKLTIGGGNSRSYHNIIVCSCYRK